MYVGKNFSSAAVGESEVYGFNFVNDLPAGEVVSSSAWTCEAVEGTDASASSRLSGSPAVVANDDGNNTIAAHRVLGLLAGVTYRLRCLATTDSGNVLELHALVACRAPKS